MSGSTTPTLPVSPLPTSPSGTPKAGSTEGGGRDWWAEEVAADTAKCHRLQPLKRLPRKLNLWYGAKRPRLLWFGIGFGPENLMACAKKHGFWPETDELSYVQKLTRARYSAEDLLRKLTGWRYIEIRDPYSLEHERIIGIYSSYWICERVLDAQTQARVLDTIKEELGLDDDPMWYYDRRNYDYAYLKSFPKRYPKVMERERQRFAKLST
ncbi:hypothetical protein BC834DRAFT_853281 [Gloeopeniophorella convolvens]|nr:hypothetical protein BC834DRAFT_853281 [Gloeopeniophorella convolvens]